MKPFKPEHYYRAALERMGQAHLLYRDGNSYAICIYTAGLAVKCMLRAFKGKRDTTFDEKHDLERLLAASGLLGFSGEDVPGLSGELVLQYQREFQNDLAIAYLIWSNDCRFASEDRFRTHLRKAEVLRRSAKGDILKSAAFRLVNACQRFIHRGSELWPHL